MFDKYKEKKPGPVRVNEPGLTQPTAMTSPALQTPGRPAIIGPGITINGDIGGSENLVIEGKVKGHVRLASNELTVGPSGEVNADVSAKVIRVAGKVHGDLTAKEKVIITSTGNVRGNIMTPRILLEDGAIFKGSIDMDPGEASPAHAAAAGPRAAVKPGNSPESITGAGKSNADHILKSG